MHVIMIVLHIMAAIFLLPALFITIPAHIIIVILAKNNAPASETQQANVARGSESQGSRRMESLEDAVASGDAAYVDVLLARGANPNVVNHYGKNLLALLQEINGHSEIARLLEKAGAK